MSARVCAVVVDWNGAAWTRACLRALAQVRFDGTLDVVVVDNGSDDPSALADVVAQPHVRVVRLPRNVGFGAGSNAGIRVGLEEGADWIWLLNNDAEPEPGALHAMLVAGEARADGPADARTGTDDQTNRFHVRSPFPISPELCAHGERVDIASRVVPRATATGPLSARGSAPRAARRTTGCLP